MKKIYLVVGASGSGKDTIIDNICACTNAKKTISRTTRNPRYIGENTHIFVSDNQADKEFSKAVGKTVFNGYRYYTLYDDLEDFYAIDPNGVRTFDKLKFDTEIIFLKINIGTRAWRMFKRGDKIKEIYSRLLNDYKEFKNFELEADVTFVNNQLATKYLIQEIIKG